MLGELLDAHLLHSVRDDLDEVVSKEERTMNVHAPEIPNFESDVSGSLRCKSKPMDHPLLLVLNLPLELVTECRRYHSLASDWFKSDAEMGP